MISLEAFRRLSGPCSWLELLGVEFPPGARAIMSAACASPASPEVLDAWRSITTAPYPTELVAQLILQIGRGGLKSSTAFVLALDRLLRFDHRESIAEGTEVLSLLVAPAKPQASAIVRNGLPLAQALAELLGGTVEERSLRDGAELAFSIPGAGFVPVLKVAAADEGTIRGGAYVFMAATEAGWFPSSSKSKNTLADIRVAIVPRMRGQFAHSIEILESTNGPPAGYFFDVCTETPITALKIGPLTPGKINPTIDVERLRVELDPAEFDQEIACTAWGLKQAAWIGSRDAMAIVDEDAGWTDGSLGFSPRSRVAFDHGGTDEIACVSGRKAIVELSPGNQVEHLVIDFADYWRPGTSRVPTHEQLSVARKVATTLGGVPILCDGRAFADVSDDLSKIGYRAPDVREDEERKRWLSRGGKIVVQMPMDPKRQTERFTRLRQLVAAGRVHVVNSEGGRELARQLTTLRATQLASRFLRVEAESGSEDGLADCLSYIAEAFDSMPAPEADGTTTRSFITNVRWSDEGLEYDRVCRRFGPNGEDLGPAEFKPDDPYFPTRFMQLRSIGVSSAPELDAFVRMRRGLAANVEIGPDDLRAVEQDIARSGEVSPNVRPIYVEPVEDPIEKLKRHARRR